jgi:pilus assembly protein FimV
MKGLKKSSLAVALALASSQALALGLGPIQVKSGLNQPLSAEIPVIAESPAEVNDLRAALASSEDFQRVGLSRERVSVPIEFNIGSNGRGQTVIKLSTKESVSEPFLDFLIEVNWGKGKLLREYTVLLDPPVAAPAIVTTNKSTTAPVAAAPAVSTPPPRPKPVESAPLASQVQPTPAKPAAAPTAAPAPAARTASSGQYGPVEKGQNLSGIARGLSANDGSNVNQLMLALLKANPDAFYRDNVNALKAGAVLRIPSADEISAVGSVREAVTALRAQNQAWQQDTGKPTLVSQTGAPTDTASDAKSSVATKPEHLALVPPSSGKDDATSDRAGSGSGSGRGSSESRAELARAKEALANREHEASELKTQVKSLEDINEKGQRLISLKDSEIADLQNKLKQLQAAKSVTPVAAIPADVAAAKPVPAPAAPPASAVTAPPPDNAKPATPPPASPVVITPPPTPETAPPPAATPPVVVPPAPVVATPAATKPAPPPVATPAKPAVVPAAPVAASKPWYSDLTGSTTLLYAIGILLLLVGGWVLSRFLNKPKPTARPTFGKESPLGAPAVVDEEAAALAGEGQEQHLLDRLAQNPDDVAVSLELLRHYYVQGDAPRFEALAETLHPHLSDDSLEWQEVAAMGEGLLPHHPLFRAHDGEAGDPAQTFAFEHDHKLTQPAVPANYGLGDEPKFDHLGLDRTGLDESAAATDLTTQRFDFSDLEAHAQEHAAAVPSASDAVHAAEYPGYERTTTEPVPHDQVARDLAGFEFDNAHSELLHRAATPEAPLPAHETGLEDLALDEDLIGTRLDLARAYIDMGDTEGARSMLDEVLNEGNEAQKNEARQLLSEL